jgi:hypothetical protein
MRGKCPKINFSTPKITHPPLVDLRVCDQDVVREAIISPKREVLNPGKGGVWKAGNREPLVREVENLSSAIGYVHTINLTKELEYRACINPLWGFVIPSHDDYLSATLPRKPPQLSETERDNGVGWANRVK